MASPQFLHLLEQLHKNTKTKKLAWQPVKTEKSDSVFRVALGEGILRIESQSDDEWTRSASYRAVLLTRDGQFIDEAEASQIYDMEHFDFLRDIFHSARAAAFNLDRLIDGMQDDLESGRSRDLPPDKDDDHLDEIPY